MSNLSNHKSQARVLGAFSLGRRVVTTQASSMLFRRSLTPAPSRRTTPFPMVTIKIAVCLQIESLEHDQM